MAVETSVLPQGTHVFQFKDIVLHRYLLSFSDTRKGRVAVHEFMDRDGGRTEEMGRSPAQLSVTLFFADEDGLQVFRQLASSLDEGRTGTLIHPIHGQMRATCLGWDKAQTEIASSANGITVPLEFVESAVDAKLARPGAGVYYRVEDVADRGNQLATLAQAFGPTAKAAADDLVNTAVTWSFTIKAAMDGGESSGAAIGTQLDAITGKAEQLDAMLGVSTDDTFISDADAYDAIAANALIAAACLDLKDEFDARMPTPIEYMVPGDVHYLTLAARFYGTDGAARAHEILENNPGIMDPSRIPAGAVLLMASPTV